MSRRAVATWGPLRRPIQMTVGLLASPWRAGSVAMFHMGRCGSTVLAKMLEQHPRIFWDGEIYERVSPRLYHRLGPRGFLRFKQMRAGRRFYGFEVKLLKQQHFRLIDREMVDYVNLIRSMAVRHFIILERRNYLRSRVSAMIGKQNSQWHRAGSGDARRTAIEMDVEHIRIGDQTRPLLDWLTDFDQRYTEIGRLLENEHTLRLNYEDDISADPQNAYQKICSFLDLAAIPVTVPIGKVNPFKLSDIITNFDHVQRALAGTAFEWMLSDQAAAGQSA